MGFGPDPDKARTLDARMHGGLRESLDHISEAVLRGAQEAESEAGHTALTGLHEIVLTIPRARSFPPAAFGFYYELVFALTGDDLAAARMAAERLKACVPDKEEDVRLQIFRLGQDRDRDEIYLRRMDEFPDGFFNPPPETAVDEFAPRFEAARTLLQRSAPELLEEIDAIVREIMLATGKPREEMQFDGASAYQLWGLLFLNPAFHPNAVALAEVLAHESGHSVLFGHTYDEPLVFNPDTELHPSPLRLDPRPMDGIFHATWVSARMHWAMSRIANDRSVSGEERDAARKAAESDVTNFAEGLAVIEAHGDLSGIGRALLNEARDYMKSAA